MNKEINIDEISKEVRKEIYSKMKDELPNFFKDKSSNQVQDLGSLLGEVFKLSIDTSMNYADELVKQILEKSNQSSGKDLK